MNHTKNNPYWEILELAMLDTPPVIVPKGVEDEAYFDMLRASIREHAAPAELVSAKVKEPGFKHRPLESTVTGYLLAKNVASGAVGYWLVYVPQENEYYCFWGPDKESLGAYGVCGNPIYCWWD